jgi:superfamily II DNA or RNA helicase
VSRDHRVAKAEPSLAARRIAQGEHQAEAPSRDHAEEELQGVTTHPGEDIESLGRELVRLRQENERLRALLGMPVADEAALPPIEATLFPTLEALPQVEVHSPVAAKVALFRSLFRAREDVYAVRWVSTRTGKAGYSPAVAGGWAGRGSSSNYLPLTDEVVDEHLVGSKTIGVYPLLEGDACWFLACDFDGPAWALDSLAYLASCRAEGIPAALERSRSGQGGHAWIFFSGSVSAVSARRLGTYLLRATMARRAEMDLESYDRLFPSQDFVPRGSFGNLIALPLHGKCREQGNTEFLDPSSLEPWPDQWAFLSAVRRLSPEAVEAFVGALGDIPTGPSATSWNTKAPMSERRAPARIRCAIGAMIAVEKAELPPSLLSSIKHLASLHNPMFHERQRLRLSTFKTPRFIRCYQEDLSHVHIPRGLLEDLRALVRSAGSTLVAKDFRPVPPSLSLSFRGSLSELQADAVTTMGKDEHGVLVAPPGTGKTVMGCALIGARNVPTLVLVHRKPLLEQWRGQLAATMGLSGKEIGEIGAGRDRRTGIVDVAMIQSLSRRADLEELFTTYGLLVIDECHHVPAFSVESCLRRASARYFLGLTATPYRRDGLQDIITMQCGPIRTQISPSQTEARAELALHLRVRETPFTFAGGEEASIQDVFRALVEDGPRTELIVQDVVAALAMGRRCLVLSQWKEHVERLARGMLEAGKEPFVLQGGLGKKARMAIMEAVGSAPPEDDLVVVATGQYLGEGFDCPPLDTLFLAFPVAFKGKLVQYTGRLMRTHEGKDLVTVYDYADSRVPVLKAMLQKRLRAYKTLGFTSR